LPGCRGKTTRNSRRYEDPGEFYPPMDPPGELSSVPYPGPPGDPEIPGPIITWIPGPKVRMDKSIDKSS